jgi:hypothetical protein
MAATMITCQEVKYSGAYVNQSLRNGARTCASSSPVLFGQHLKPVLEKVAVKGKSGGDAKALHHSKARGVGVAVVLARIAAGVGDEPGGQVPAKA